MRPRASAALVLAAAATLVAAACGVPTEKGFEAVDARDIPYGLADTTTTTIPQTTTTSVQPAVTPPPTTTAPTEVVRVYFVLGRGVRPVDRARRPPVTPLDALRSLQAGPREEDRPVGLRSSILPDMLRDVKVAGGIATVDLDSSLLGLSTNEQVLAFAQIVATLTERPGIGPVAFTIEGTAVEPYRGDGSLAEGPTVSRDDYRNLLPFDPTAPTTTAAPTTTTITTATPPPTTPAP